MGNWALRYYSPAKKCKLDSAWIGSYLVVSLAGWAVGRWGGPVALYYMCPCNGGRGDGSTGAFAAGLVECICCCDGYWDNGASGGIPMACDGTYTTAEYKDPRNEFETVDGMPVYYGGDLNDSDCENPGDIDYETWVDWCHSG